MPRPQWERWMRRQRNQRCHYCGERVRYGSTLTLDHIVPQARGGPHAWWNVVPACQPCNLDKANEARYDHCRTCADAWAEFQRHRAHMGTVRYL